MIRKLTASAIAALVLSTGGAMAKPGGVQDFAFSYEGPFGTFDQNQLQRGLKVYAEVCAACHGLKFVPLRTLGDEGGPSYTEDEVRAFAEQFTLMDEFSNPSLYDPEADEYRTLVPADNFPANNSQGAPDLSLMAKARAGFSGPVGTGLNQLFRGMGGGEYIASFLTAYTGEEKEEAGSILYENTVFPGGWTAMAPQLYGEDVEFDDGSSTDAQDEALDVAAFLMWAAEPKMMARQRTGFIAVTLMVLLSVLLYLTNKAIWAPIKGKKQA